MNNSKNNEKGNFRKVAIETNENSIEIWVKTGLSNKDIAEKLGIPESTVRSIRYHKDV